MKLLISMLLFFAFEANVARACEMNTKNLYVLAYSPGPQWEAGVEIWNQKLADHGEYMANLNSQGLIKLAGPFTDSSGGMAVLCVASLAEASQILSNDPAIRSGVFVGHVTEWFVAFDGKTAQ
jgi:uncharacterized protein